MSFIFYAIQMHLLTYLRRPMEYPFLVPTTTNMSCHQLSQQCVQAYSKANKLLGVLNRTIKCKDTGNLLCFYKSLIRPHLEFCTAAWSPHYVKDKVLIERIQRRFTKMIPHLKNIPYEERLAKLQELIRR